MALNFDDQETLRPQLVPRIKQALRKFLMYVQGGNGHSTARQEWATANMANLTTLSEQLSHYVTSESAFIDTGTSITDAAISSRIESVLADHFMPA